MAWRASAGDEARSLIQSCLPKSYADFQGFKSKRYGGLESLGNYLRSRATGTFPAFLDRRAGYRPERTEHAAIARQWLELLSAAFADIEELTGIGRHLFDGLKAALRAGENGFELHRYPTSLVP
jgi:hypothetical protein